MDDCTRAIDLDPMYVKAYNRRAESLRCLDGEPNEMKVHLQGALRDYEKVCGVVWCGVVWCGVVALRDYEKGDACFRLEIR